MALLSPLRATRSGTLVSTASAAGGGDTFRPGDSVKLVVANGGGSSITVTVDRTRLSNTGRDDNEGGAVAAGATRIFGPFPAADFANASDGLVHVTYSAVTSVTVYVLAN